MKKIALAMLPILFALPTPAFALFNVNQGGTGVGVLSQGGFVYGNGTSPVGVTSNPTIGYLTATSTTASSFAGDVNVAGSIQGSAINATGIATSSFGILTADRISNSAVSDWRIQGGNIFRLLNGTNPDTGIVIGPNSIDFYGFGAPETSPYISFDAPSYTFYNSKPNDPDLGIAQLDFSLIVDTEKTFTFPNFSGTFGLLENTQTWSGTNTFNKGATATTTVNFGQMGSSTSHVCFNTKNTGGDDISFYFVGTSMVVENNSCN